MSERYTQLYALKENLYTKGSPVILSAGRLLKDNQTGMVLAQLKIKNISDKTVKAAKVVLHSLDTIGKPIDGDAEKEYLDLEAEQGWEFGQKEPIIFRNQSTRGFTAEIIQVVFADNRIWESSGVTWEALPDPEALSIELNDPELIKQYKIEYGEDAVVSPCIYKDLWLCKCGTWNRNEKCYQCGSNRNALIPLDRIKLTENRNKRLAEEEKAREAARLEAERKAEEKRIAQEKAKHKTKKTLSIVIPAAVAVLIAIIVVTKVIIPNNNYNKAVALMESEDYGTAITIFEALDGYKDSEGLIEECQYQTAKTIMESGDYEAAITAFKALADYKDSVSLIEECQYQIAKTIMGSGDYEAAIKAFEAVKGYKDSNELKKECNTAILDQKYKAALSLLETGNYQDAIDAFEVLGNFKDSKDQKKKAERLIIEEAFNSKYGFKYGINIPISRYGGSGEYKGFVYTKLYAGKLDDNIRFTLLYEGISSPIGFECAFFNPPNGDIIMVSDRLSNQETGVFSISIPIRKIEAVNEITISMNGKGDAGRPFAFVSMNSLKQFLDEGWTGAY